jgi:hypothetical protein
MKTFIYPLLAAVLMMAACKKEDTVRNGSGSIIRAASSAGPAGFVNDFNAQDSTAAISLMNSNNISLNGFGFYFYESYNALDQNNQMGLYQIAEARQIRNGLPVFFADLTYGFENGKLNGPPPAPQYIIGTILLDNKPNLTLNDVRNSFIKADNAREASNISIGDSILVAQLGYYDLNLDQPGATGTNYIKAWYVHTRYKGWPQGYVRDDNGNVLGLTPLTHKGPVHP